MSPPPMGLGSGEGAVPTSEIFLTFWLEIVHFGVYSDTITHAVPKAS